MKLKKKFKMILFFLLLIVLGLVGYLFYQKYKPAPEAEEVKVIHQMEKYGYSLKENKTKEYKKMYKELETILNEKEVDEEAYVKKIAEMFIYDFYSLNDKTAKTDIGGVDFIYSGILENVLQNAQNTYYKYIENNIYENRKQSLPVVSDIEITSVKQEAFAYADKNDEKAYIVDATWSYTDSQFSEYQRKATLVFIHEDQKLSLVELQ
ncbi:MAG: hypothetical protein IJI60_01620 [Bacilli bacterium]|nr:hypothetical protein [Bacilli bacterium]